MATLWEALNRPDNSALLRARSALVDNYKGPIASALESAQTLLNQKVDRDTTALEQQLRTASPEARNALLADAQTQSGFLDLKRLGETQKALQAEDRTQAAHESALAFRDAQTKDITIDNTRAAAKLAFDKEVEQRRAADASARRAREEEAARRRGISFDQAQEDREAGRPAIEAARESARTLREATKVAKQQVAAITNSSELPDVKQNQLNTAIEDWNIATGSAPLPPTLAKSYNKQIRDYSINVDDILNSLTANNPTYSSTEKQELKNKLIQDLSSRFQHANLQTIEAKVDRLINRTPGLNNKFKIKATETANLTELGSIPAKQAIGKAKTRADLANNLGEYPPNFIESAVYTKLNKRGGVGDIPPNEIQGAITNVYDKIRNSFDWDKVSLPNREKINLAAYAMLTGVSRDPDALPFDTDDLVITGLGKYTDIQKASAYEVLQEFRKHLSSLPLLDKKDSNKKAITLLDEAIDKAKSTVFTNSGSARDSRLKTIEAEKKLRERIASRN